MSDWTIAEHDMFDEVKRIIQSRDVKALSAYLSGCSPEKLDELGESSPEQRESMKPPRPDLAPKTDDELTERIDEQIETHADDYKRLARDCVTHHYCECTAKQLKENAALINTLSANVRDEAQKASDYSSTLTAIGKLLSDDGWPLDREVIALQIEGKLAELERVKASAQTHQENVNRLNALVHQRKVEMRQLQSAHSRTKGQARQQQKTLTLKDQQIKVLEHELRETKAKLQRAIQPNLASTALALQALSNLEPGPDYRVIDSVAAMNRGTHPRCSFTAGEAGCGEPVMTDRHGFYESMCALHLVEHLKQQVLEGPDDTKPEPSMTGDEVRARLAATRLMSEGDLKSVQRKGDVVVFDFSDEPYVGDMPITWSNPPIEPAFEVNQLVLVNDDASNQTIPENWPQWEGVLCRIEVHNANEDLFERRGGRHYLVYAQDNEKHGRAGRWVSAAQMMPRTRTTANWAIEAMEREDGSTYWVLWNHRGRLAAETATSSQRQIWEHMLPILDHLSLGE